MFSCCRANTKKDKTKINKQNAQQDNDDDPVDKDNSNEELKGEQLEAKAEVVVERKLIIPTITVQNGKDINEPVVDCDGDEENNKYDNNTSNNINGDIKNPNNTECTTKTYINGHVTDAQIARAAVSGEEAGATTTTTADILADEKMTTAKMDIVESEQNDSDEHTSSKKSTPTSYTDESIDSITINQVLPLHGAGRGTAATTTPPMLETDTESPADDLDENDVGGEMEFEADSEPETNTTTTTNRHQQEQNNSYNSHSARKSVTEDVPTKSCLSRHNSMHTSSSAVKKKVNISECTEIIEPEPLPPPPYALLMLDNAGAVISDPLLCCSHSNYNDVDKNHNNSSNYNYEYESDVYYENVDDDEVFSDSIPAPKRESMCAPYIERLGKGGSLADVGGEVFTHGLPDWFNDERINENGCLEPPVTPVGRDELEMRRQRLYADLLRAAQAAVEHSVRFMPVSADVMLPPGGDRRGKISSTTVTNQACDSDFKPSVAENLENLVNRLEKLVERLERSISARELEIANRTFDTVLEKKRESFDLEAAALPPVPLPNDQHLAERIVRIESSLNRINDRHSSSLSASQNSQEQAGAQFTSTDEGSLENIPTVLEDYQATLNSPLPPPSPLLSASSTTINMSVLGYQDIVNGPVSQYLALSAKIGGDVAKQAALVKTAFDAQLQYVNLATQCAKPSQDKQMQLLNPTSVQISAIQEFREKNRASPFFNHLSAISESIPALGWVCVSPTPGPHVKEMNDAGQFYTNRVLKDWKEKDATHVEWARAWIQTLTELQAYIKQYHTTGLVWSGKGAASAPPPPPPSMSGCPPPPPPPAFDLAAMSLDGSADERSALFAEINQGENITKNLKKVTSEMQTHKNPTLRTGPAPFKTPSQFGSAPQVPTGPVIKEPVFTRDGKKWIIEHQRNNTGLLVENAEMNNVVYVFKCEGSTLTVKGKVNNIVFDSCKKCSLLFDSVVASVEFVNCQSVQMQVLGSVPTISIDKTDGCQMYLSKDSMAVEVVSSKSSEMNVMLPETNGDYTELAVPEQYKTTIKGKTLKTICVDSLG